MNNAWESRRSWWHIGFAIMVTVACIIELFDDTFPIGRRVLGVVLAGALAALYAAVGRRVVARPSTLALYLAYIVPALALETAMLQVSPAFFVLLIILYPQVFASAPRFRWSVIGAVVLTVVTGVASARWRDHPYSASAVGAAVVQGAITLTFAICFGLWIQRIIAESRGRADLIVELDQARSALAVANREAGMLGERERLAGEIHDTLAQGFTSILMLLQAAEVELGRDDDAVRRHVLSAQRTARENLAEARALVAALQPVVLQSATLPDAIRRLAERCRDDTGALVDLQVEGEARVLEPNEEVALLRAAQEALTNVRKHAAADHVTMRLLYAPDDVTLTVSDDGNGFDVDSVAGGFGLRGLRARLEQVGGAADVSSRCGHGTTVRVTVQDVGQR
jgi:signal transduction histidine kinase